MAEAAAPPAERPEPLISYRGRVAPNWVDVNRHMNVSWYDRVFDMAEHTLFEAFGIEDGYIARTRLSIFRLERLVRYERELLEADAIEVASRVVWTDFRRVHHFHELRNVAKGYRAASVDALSIHVDLRLRKSAPMSLPETTIPLARLAREHALLPQAEGVLARINGRRTSA